MSDYIEFDKESINFNYDEEMKKVQEKLKELFNEESKYKSDIKEILGDLGYEI